MATVVVADAAHIDMPVESTQEHSCDHDDLKNVESRHEQTDNHGTPQGHDCCHENHVHFYTMIPKTNFEAILNLSYIDFTFCYSNYPATILDIVKPPLV